MSTRLGPTRKGSWTSTRGRSCLNLRDNDVASMVGSKAVPHQLNRYRRRKISQPSGRVK
jgi:hypothetical protein